LCWGWVFLCCSVFLASCAPYHLNGRAPHTHSIAEKCIGDQQRRWIRNSHPGMWCEKMTDLSTTSCPNVRHGIKSKNRPSENGPWHSRRFDSHAETIQDPELKRFRCRPLEVRRGRDDVSSYMTAHDEGRPCVRPSMNYGGRSPFACSATGPGAGAGRVCWARLYLHYWRSRRPIPHAVDVGATVG